MQASGRVLLVSNHLNPNEVKELVFKNLDVVSDVQSSRDSEILVRLLYARLSLMKIFY